MFEFIFSFSSGFQRLNSPILAGAADRGGGRAVALPGINLLRKRDKVSWDDRDLFWPVLFVGFGVLWLLVNLKRLPFDNLGVLIGLWPVLLVAAGLDLLVGRRWPVVGALLGAAVVAGLVWMAVNVDRYQLETRFPTFSGWEEYHRREQYTERVIGSGVMKEEKRTVQSFKRIRMEGAGWRRSPRTRRDQNSLTITADENLLPYLISEVQAGELRIYRQAGRVALAQPERALYYHGAMT